MSQAVAESAAMPLYQRPCTERTFMQRTNSILLAHLERSSKEIRAGNRVAVQNILSAFFVGGTKLSYGIQFDVAGFKYVNNPRMTNVMLGTGPIADLAGTSYAPLDNLRIQVLREVHNAQLSKKHQLPGQLLKDQLNQLDGLEKSIQSLERHPGYPIYGDAFLGESAHRRDNFRVLAQSIRFIE